jgi:hypothetical protein
MKTLVTFLFLVLAGTVYAQIPSINETNKSTAAWKLPFERIVVRDTVIENRTFKQNELISDGARDSISEKVMRAVTKEAIKKEDPDIDKIMKEGLPLHQYSIYIDNYTKGIKEYDLQVKELKTEIGKKKKFTDVQVLMDSITDYKQRIKLSRVFVNDLVKKRNDSLGWFPSSKTDFRDDFFSEYFNETGEHTNYLNNLSIVFGSATVHSELVSDYLGPVRLTFGTVINTDSDSDDTDEADEAGEPDGRVNADEADGESDEAESDLKRLVNGGGNFYLNGLFPVHSYKELSFSEMTSINGNLSSDIEGIGNDVKTTNLKGMLNVTTYLSMSSDNKKFNFFINADYGLVGGTDDFCDQFGLKGFFNKPAFIGKATIGITLENMVRLTITTKTISNYDSLVTDKIMVGIQLLK